MSFVKIRKLRDLELIIQEIPGYRSPKLQLEQYVTDANIVATAVWDAYMRGYLTNARVLDLGCGTGRFAIAASIMGARHVVCIDIDNDAIIIAKEHAQKYGLNNIDMVTMDVKASALMRRFDIVFQNPPFGIWSGKGTDIDFLKIATNYGNTIYTIHKLSTLGFISRKVKSWGCEINVVDKVTITIPPMYRHHKMKKYKVEVFLARVECPRK